MSKTKEEQFEEWFENASTNELEDNLKDSARDILEQSFIGSRQFQRAFSDWMTDEFPSEMDSYEESAYLLDEESENSDNVKEEQ